MWKTTTSAQGTSGVGSTSASTKASWELPVANMAWATPCRATAARSTSGGPVGRGPGHGRVSGQHRHLGPVLGALGARTGLTPGHCRGSRGPPGRTCALRCRSGTVPTGPTGQFGQPAAGPVARDRPATSSRRQGRSPRWQSDMLSTIIGKPTGTTVVTVERGQLALFADAVKEKSPDLPRPEGGRRGRPGRHPRPADLPLRHGELRRLPRAADRRTARRAIPMAEVLGPLMANGGLILHGEQEFTYHRPVLPATCWSGRARWPTPTARSPRARP